MKIESSNVACLFFVPSILGCLGNLNFGNDGLNSMSFFQLSTVIVSCYHASVVYVVVAARAVFTNMLLYEIAMSMERRMSGTQYLVLQKILCTYRPSI